MSNPPMPTPMPEPAEGADGASSVYFSREAVSGVPWMVANKLAMIFVYPERPNRAYSACFLF